MDKLSLNAPRVMCFPHICTQSRPSLTLTSCSTNFYGCHLAISLLSHLMQVPCTNKGGHAPCKIEQCFTYTCSHRFGTKDIKWRVSKTTFECAADTKLNPIS